MSAFPIPVPVLAAEGGSSILKPDGSLFFILILFLVLVPLLNRILFRPITHVLNERERLTQGSSTDAVAILHSIDVKLGDYEEGIRGARSEGYRIIEARRAQANAERQAKIDSARAEAEQKIAGARAEIAHEAEMARAGLELDAREIADRISATLLGRAVGGGR